jgi:hypothetical protein
MFHKNILLKEFNIPQLKLKLSIILKLSLPLLELILELELLELPLVSFLLLPLMLEELD